MGAAVEAPVAFRAAWLLLLLRDGLGHGYELNRAPAMRTLCRDAATTYRTLRTMELRGLVQSRWEPSHGAPPRRVYAITAAGMSALADSVSEVLTLRDSCDAFLSSYAASAPAADSSSPSRGPGS
jgi:DNA-binding PadR family transcriptional regulator